MYHQTPFSKLFRFLFPLIFLLTLSVIQGFLFDQRPTSLGLGFFLPSYSVYAAETDVVFSEIMYDPEGSDTDFEWLELYNKGLSPVTIIGGSSTSTWRIGDGSSNRTLAESAYMGDMVIEAQGFMVLARNPAQFMIRYPDYQGDLVQINSLSLSNSGDAISLKIGTAGIPWETVSYSPSWGGEDGKSLEKIDVSGGDDQTNWVSSKDIHGSPGESYVGNEPPIADVGNDQTVKEGEEVEFDASNSSDPDGEIISYYFEFGDGDDALVYENSVMHIYETSGSYTVSLTVADESGAEDTDTLQVTVEEIVYSDKVILSEILPSPGEVTDWDSNGTVSYQDEWIELYNTGNVTVDLSGWLLDDIEEGSGAYEIPAGTEIRKAEYLVFYRKDTGITLNNDSDSVRLLNPKGAVVEEFSYEETADDVVYAKDEEGNWELSITPTLGEENVITKEENDEDDDSDEEEENEEEESDDEEEENDHEEAEEVKEYSIKEVKKLELGEVVMIKGFVTATPEILGSQVIYLQDGTAGIKVKLTERDYETVSLGDKIRVSGILSEAYEEWYLKLDSESTFEILSHVKPLTPKGVKTGEIGEKWEGLLVRINGQITATSGNTFYLNDGSGEIKVYIKDSTEIDKPKMRTGYYAEVIGIVSQYRDDYRVLPRYQEDIIVSEEPINEGSVLGDVTELPKTGREGLEVGIIAMVIGGILKIVRKMSSI